MSYENALPVFSHMHKDNPMLHLSIGKRLGLAFLTSTLIVTVFSWIVGSQQALVLQKQANFYQDLLQANITLTTDSNYLNLMNAELDVFWSDASSSHPSKETMTSDRNTIEKLANLYSTMLSHYSMYDLLEQRPTEANLLIETGHTGQVVDQRVLAGSALRSWHTYLGAQKAILQDIAASKLQEARNLEQSQGEPTFSDALSSLHALQRFDLRLISVVEEATQVETQKALVEAILAALLACASITIIGWSISHTLVPRLKHLQHGIQTIRQGNLNARVAVHGHDEIADVSTSINNMLRTMLEERQSTITYERQRRLSQLKDQFIVNVNHELRTPLTEVYGYLELLSEYHEHVDSATRIAFIDHAKTGCQELMYLVDTILDATPVTHEIKHPQLEKINMHQFICNLQKHLTPQEAHCLHLVVPEHLVVLADQQYLHQVLHNLLSNAFKYAPQDTLVTISAQSDEDARQGIEEYDVPHARICVKDAGPGIPPDEIPLLFQKFGRLKRDLSGTVRGTGLGLYISKQILLSMHGDIWVESSGVAGEGSCFYFTLPLAAPKPAFNTTV